MSNDDDKKQHRIRPVHDSWPPTGHCDDCGQGPLGEIEWTDKCPGGASA